LVLDLSEFFFKPLLLSIKEKGASIPKTILLEISGLLKDFFRLNVQEAQKVVLATDFISSLGKLPKDKLTQIYISKILKTMLLGDREIEL
jgi:hypothetical protein